MVKGQYLHHSEKQHLPPLQVHLQHAQNPQQNNSRHRVQKILPSVEAQFNPK
jgi:hypothetical protein